MTSAIQYYHAIYIVLKYFASFTGYEHDIFEVTFNLDVQESKFGKKYLQIWRKIKQKVELRGIHGVHFPCLGQASITPDGRKYQMH